MANYGPPGRGDPEPWPGRWPDEAYGPPGGTAGQAGWNEPRSRRPEYPHHPSGGSGGWPAASDGPPHHSAGPGQSYGTDPYPPPYGGEPYRPGEYPPGPYRPTPGHGDRRPTYAAQPGPDAGPYPAAEQAYASRPGALPGPAGYARPPRRRSRGPAVTVLAAVLALVLGGGAAVFYLLGQDDPAPVTGTPTPAAETPVPPSDGTAAPSAAAPESSADPRFVKVGQCVRNEGPAGGRPRLLISECAPESYEVLRRVDGTTSGEKDAAAKCANVPGYTNWYFFDSELDTLDFVLCLKQR
ncbi:flagellar basal body protein FliL [Micromonospora deserti]|uniref:Flagellar basal body protein FliL n=1 Tax=Micromonospora deserti TaxID=2070366 RepID=A0A2W2D9B0_9ACTN|nr:flagellar basal body protein FliL [Micromonospora deserti]